MCVCWFVSYTAYVLELRTGTEIVTCYILGVLGQFLKEEDRFNVHYLSDEFICVELGGNRFSFCSSSLNLICILPVGEQCCSAF